MTYRELLGRLTDLKGLAQAAPVGETGGCMSSRDRASAYDEKTDTYTAWDANDDGSGCIRMLADGSIVAFECEGPGVIWRVWSALPERGHMRIYVDNPDTPIEDLPFIDWFERQRGELPPLNLSELSLRLSRGRNSFIPIPFGRYCRIELTPGWGAYYHFTYTRFPEEAELPRYEERYTRDGMIALAETDRMLYERGEQPLPVRTIERTIASGQSECLYEADGMGAIRELSFFPTDEQAVSHAMRTLILRIRWDGRQKAAVEAPIGDFFGGGPGYAHYRCLPMSMERSRFTCRFYMPFETGCRVEICNLGSSTEHVRMAFALDEHAKVTASTLRFHAKWHRGYNADANARRFAPDGDRWPDWPLLLVPNAGGRFVGVHLHVLNTWPKPKREADTWWYGRWDQKSVDWWWGEGDEKLFIDGERFPSTFGTGSEDYIGYAWAAEPPFARFDSPFAMMNHMPIDGNGHTSVSRFHVADSVPFQNRFEGYLEKYKADVWGDEGRCLFAATPYWYQQAHTDDAYPPITHDLL